MYKLGFIGFGEAAFYLTADLIEGSTELFAFDVVSLQDTARGAEIRQRAQTNGVTLVDSMEALFQHAQAVFCLTNASSALPIAKQIAPLLTNGQLYIDMNSTSPTTKEDIYAVLQASQGDFVEAAIMASVPANRSRVSVYLCGEKAVEAAKIAEECGMNFTVLSPLIGAASATKMIKSVLFKGFIALLTETVFAAERYGITEQTLDALKSILTEEMTFEEAINYFLCTMAIHSERLGYEMEEVLTALHSMGENDIMTQATLQKMRWITQQGYGQEFAIRPESYKAIIAYRDRLEQQGK